MAEVNKKLEIIRQTVFEYLVLRHPTIEQAEKGVGTEIVVPVTVICAIDEEAARLQASRDIPQRLMKSQARLEVVVRPF